MRRLLAFTLVLIGTGYARAAAAPPRGDVREVFDVRYCAGSNSRHKLDLFLPASASSESRRPVVIFVHGGTWMIGDKNYYGIYRGVGRLLGTNGFVGVAINYRLSPLVKHPEHVKDVARAFAWVRRNIARYGGDPDRIFLAGHSAGAHLVSLLAADPSYLKDPKLKLDDKDRAALKGVVSVSGVYRIPPPAEFKQMAQGAVDHLVGAPGSGKMAATLGPALMLVSGAVNPFRLVFGKETEVQEKASPITHVRRGLPPFLMLNAEYEVTGLHGMAADFRNSLTKQGVPVEHHQIEGTTHRSIVKKMHRADDEAARLVLAWLKRHAE